MFCPQCGVATEAHIKFCKACGFKLADFDARSESPNAAEAQNQLRRLKGTRTLAASLLLWPPTLLALLIGASAHGPEAEVSQVTAVFLTLFAFGASGWGVFNLWRGGFFRSYKEQRIRAEATLLAAQTEPVRLPSPRATPHEIASTPVTATMPQFGESITEHTTRSLHPQFGIPNKLD